MGKSKEANTGLKLSKEFYFKGIKELDNDNLFKSVQYFDKAIYLVREIPYSSFHSDLEYKLIEVLDKIREDKKKKLDSKVEKFDILKKRLELDDFPVSNAEKHGEIYFDLPEVEADGKVILEKINEIYCLSMEILLTNARKLIFKDRLEEGMALLNEAYFHLENFKKQSDKTIFSEKIRELVVVVKSPKIRNTLLEFSNSGRLQIVEIAEASGEKEDLIVQAVKMMIEEGDINAKYFESTRSILFTREKIEALSKGLREKKVFCKNCGKEVSDVNQELCEYCGYKLEF